MVNGTFLSAALRNGTILRFMGSTVLQVSRLQEVDQELTCGTLLIPGFSTLAGSLNHQSNLGAVMICSVSTEEIEHCSSSTKRV